MASCAPPRPLLLPRALLLVPKPDPDSAPAAQAQTATTTPPLTAALRRELQPSPDDHSDFANRLRLTERRLDAISARLPSAPPLPPPPPPITSPARTSAAAAARASSRTVRGRKRHRGTTAAEMVRVAVTAEAAADLMPVRAATRRARLTFEALRGLYTRANRDRPDHRANRPDNRALAAMISSDLCLYRDKRIVGPVPGVLVGDAFTYRAELIVVGLHNHTQAAISYVPATLVTEGHPVATSIVSSADYLHDHGNGDVLVYTGSGGAKPPNGSGKHHADQDVKRGNLALAYSCKYGVEVRVIRCHHCDASPSGKLYVYDGLYKVESSTYDPGNSKSGGDLCRFNLVRLPGQDDLGSNDLRLARELTAAFDANIRPIGYLTLDLARGKEAVRVPICNVVDDDRSPLEAEYIARPVFAPSTTARPRSARGGRCCIYKTTACGAVTSSLSGCCACVKRNGGGGGLAYNADGTLVRGMPVVYECGAQCGCPPSCPNRATQRGVRHRLEVFRSRATDWGVRTLDLIQPGAFVCEISGELVPVDDGRLAGTTSRTEWGGFVDPRKFPPRWREWGDASAAAGLPDNDVVNVRPPPFPPQCPAPAYVLDVSKRRNFGPYICHSGAPNTFVQFVVRGGESESCPHLMVFASETIPPLSELCIDYGIGH
ncbi:unnamed protein product [Alopecurus aequalis]